MILNQSFEVGIGQYPFAEALKEEVVPVFEKYKDKQGRRTNVKATMTEWNISSPQIERFKKYILNEIQTFYKPSTFIEEGEEKNEKFEIKDLWGNVYNKGDYTLSHNHFPCVYSFAYFLKSKWHHAPFVFTESKKRIRPQEGKFIFFPAYVLHHVSKHNFKEQRMTLSGNIKVKSK